MPEFAFGVDPFRKGTSSNPFPPDTPHSQLDSPITLMNPSTTDTVNTDYGPIPPGGSIQVPALTDFDLSLISSGLLQYSATNSIPEMAPVTGICWCFAAVTQGSLMIPTASATGFFGVRFSTDLNLTPVDQSGGYVGGFKFSTYGQTSGSGTGSLDITCSSNGGQASDQVAMQFMVEMDLAVISTSLGSSGLSVMSYTVVQDLNTGLYVIDQPPVVSPSTQGQSLLRSTLPAGIKYNSTASTDPNTPIGAIVTFTTGWVRVG